MTDDPPKYPADADMRPFDKDVSPTVTGLVEELLDYRIALYHMVTRRHKQSRNCDGCKLIKKLTQKYIGLLE